MAFVGATWGGNSFWIRMLFPSCLMKISCNILCFILCPRNNLQTFCRRFCMTGLYLFLLSRSIRFRGDVLSISRKQSLLVQIAKIKETFSYTVEEINCDFFPPWRKWQQKKKKEGKLKNVEFHAEMRCRSFDS